MSVYLQGHSLRAVCFRSRVWRGDIAALAVRILTVLAWCSGLTSVQVNVMVIVKVLRMVCAVSVGVCISFLLGVPRPSFILPLRLQSVPSGYARESTSVSARLT